jgi:purine-binding chemotaxis protein CheW
MNSTSTLPTPAQGVRAEDLVRSLLRMAVGDKVLAVPINDVREILQVTRLTPLPRTPPLVRGVMNVRGSVVPVFDLAARLGRPPTEVGRRSCIVVVEAALDTDADGDSVTPLVAGLLVDAVFEVFDCTAGDIEAVPPLGTSVDPTFLLGMTRARGDVIGILALTQVLAFQPLTDLIASHTTH